MPFFVREHAFLACRRRPSWGKKGVFFNAIRNTLISCWLSTLSEPTLYSFLEDNWLASMYWFFTMLTTSMWPGNVYYNAPWTLCAQWEINLPCELFVCHLIAWVRSISHRRTQTNRTHKGAQRHQVNRYHRTLQPPLAITFCEFCMPEAFCGLETVRKKVLLSLWVLWEKKLPSDSQASFLLQWVRSISHRFTQMNRTHKGPQRH